MQSFIIADVGPDIYQRRNNGYEIVTGYLAHLKLLVNGISVFALMQQLAVTFNLTAQEHEKQGFDKLCFYAHQSKVH